MNDAVLPKAVLEVRGLSRTFHQADVAIHVLREVDISIAPGEIVALLGPSGSGKSTLLQAVGLLEGGFAGSIRIAGEEAAQMTAAERTILRRDRLGFVYQFHHLLPDFTALENVVLPQLIGGHGPDEAAARATAVGAPSSSATATSACTGSTRPSPSTCTSQPSGVSSLALPG